MIEMDDNYRRMLKCDECSLEAALIKAAKVKPGVPKFIAESYGVDDFKYPWLERDVYG